MLKTARSRVALSCTAACLAFAGQAVAQDAVESREQELPPSLENAPEESSEEENEELVHQKTSSVNEDAMAAMQQRLEALEQELVQLKEDSAEKKAEPSDELKEEGGENGQKQGEAPVGGRVESPVQAPHAQGERGHSLGHGLMLSGYMQGEYRHQDDSEDQVSQDGKLLNQDRFLVRRMRLKITGDWEYAGAVFELDGNNTAGNYGMYIRRAEGYLQYRLDGENAPVVQLGVGVIDTLFGHDLNQSSRVRPFMERSRIVQSIWPSPADLGARLNGQYKWFNYAVQVLNGEPQNQRQGFPGLDPSSSKDFLIRVGADVPLKEGWSISGHLSSTRGKGFHPGESAFKGGALAWVDRNLDQVVNSGETQGLIARSAASAQEFDRWATGIDLQLKYRTPIGDGMVYGEAILAENMDRALFYSNPAVTGIDQRMLGYYAAFWQEITPYALIGFRYDVYEPNSNLFDSRAGKTYSMDQRITTYSPLVGLQLPQRARLMFQYDFIDDKLGRNAQGVPANLSNNAWTLRLQVQL